MGSTVALDLIIKFSLCLVRTISLPFIRSVFIITGGKFESRGLVKTFSISNNYIISESYKSFEMLTARRARKDFSNHVKHLSMYQMF